MPLLKVCNETSKNLLPRKEGGPTSKSRTEVAALEKNISGIGTSHHLAQAPFGPGTSIEKVPSETKLFSVRKNEPPPISWLEL